MAWGSAPPSVASNNIQKVEKNMKFEDKFPKMKYLDEEEGMIKGKNPVPCGVCGEPTLFIDLCSEGPFCSEECMEAFYKFYWEADFQNDYNN